MLVMPVSLVIRVSVKLDFLLFPIFPYFCAIKELIIDI